MSTMDAKEYMQWLYLLNVGDEVMLHWSAGSFGHYRAKAKLVKINKKSVVGELLEPVQGNHGGYPVGHRINVARMLHDPKFSYEINSPWPVGVDRITPIV